MVITTLIARAVANRIPSCEIEIDSIFGDMCGLDRVCIADAVETHFGIELSDAEIERWGSVADVALSIENARSM